MGYFSSLARHTGIAPLCTASRAAPPIRGIEVDSTLFAEAPAPASLGARAVAQQPAAPAPPSPAAPSPVPGHLAPAAGAPAPPLREIVVEIPAPPRVEVREHVIEVPAPLPGEDLTPPFGAATAEPSPAPSPPIAAVRIGQPEPHKEPPRERRLPTLADVRAWVARPLLEAARTPFAATPAAEASPVQTLYAARAIETPAPGPGREENYKLEIGTIRIVMDEPAAPAPPRHAAPAPSAPAWSHPSRYYLRP